MNDLSILAGKGKSVARILKAIDSELRLIGFLAILVVVVLFALLKLTPDGNPLKDWYPFLIVGLLSIMVIGIVMVLLRKSRYQENAGVVTPHASDSDYLEIISECPEALKGIAEGVEKAMKIGSPVLNKVISRKLHTFAHEVAFWENGEFRLGPTDSREFLTELYRDAKERVFSTSIQQFSEYWKSQFGEKILDANKASTAHVIRVFIFDDINEVTGEDIAEMERQAEYGIAVYVYLDKEDPAFNFPIDITKDFTIIDNGEAIGITETFDPDHNRAIWYFGRNEKRAGRFRDISNSLLNGSITYQQFKARLNEAAH